MRYNWEQPDWPNFKFDLSNVESDLLRAIGNSGRIVGAMGALAASDRSETLGNLLVTETLKNSEIEGEHLYEADVASSIRTHLGLQAPGDKELDARAKGAADLVLAVRRDFASPLTEAMILHWHQTLMRGYRSVASGTWRTHEEPMQVVTRANQLRPRIHFEAPPSERVPQEMKKFVEWFNDPSSATPDEIKMAPVRSGLAHLYFVSIHPFEDGNGRIGRAVAEKALSETLGYPSLALLSKAIESEKRDYYRELEQAQKSNEVTRWLEYFVHVVLKAQAETEAMIAFVVQKARFLEQHKTALTGRQLKVVQRMLAAGSSGFLGGITASKYMSITKVSKATATRDLAKLVSRGVLVPNGAGRSARYDLNLP